MREGRASEPCAIFLRNKEELRALKKLAIHVLRRPLFTSELAAFAGRCGVIRSPGTGEGFFLPALIPGITYNKLIEAFSSGDVDPNQREIFKAVILRAVPASVREWNGSIKLEALGAAHIQWNDDELSAAETVDLPAGDIAKSFVSALEWVGNAVRDVGQVITNVLGDLQKIFTGSVNIDLTAHALNLDDRFGLDTPMVRAWGTDAGQPLIVPGMHVTILQNLFSTFIPTTATGNTDSQGLVRINVPKVARDGVRGSGVCLRMESAASEMTGFLTSDDICDFRGFDVKRTKAVGNFSIPDFELDAKIELNVSHPEVSAFFQADDSFRYDERVLHYRPKQARVLVGYWANTLSINGRPYTPCMTIGELLPSIVLATTWAASSLVPPLLPVAVPVVAILSQNDIVLPDGSIQTSRDVTSHEYGHFTFCNLLAQTNGRGAVDSLIWGFLTGQFDQPKRYLNEAFAEYLTGQVASIADYEWLPLSASSRGDVCERKIVTDQTGASHAFACFDANLNGTVGQNANIGRMSTMLHDLFDGQNGRGQDVPNDADAWVKTNGTFIYESSAWGSTDSSPSTIGDPNYGALESVALPGNALADFAAHFGSTMELSDANWVGALSQTMADHGVNWCQRCLLVALHSAWNPGTGVRERFKACQDDPLLAGALGPAPDPSLHFEVSTSTHGLGRLIDGINLSASRGDCEGRISLVLEMNSPPDAALVPGEPAAGTLYRDFYRKGTGTCPASCFGAFLVEVEKL